MTREDLETFDRRNAIHQAMSPLLYEDERYDFVLDAASVTVTDKHVDIRTNTCPILNALSEVAGEPLRNYAWSVAPAQYFSTATGEPIKSLTTCGNRKRAIGMYLLSSATREWQLAYQERHVRHQKPVLPVTLVIHENQRLIKIKEEASF